MQTIKAGLCVDCSGPIGRCHGPRVRCKVCAYLYRREYNRLAQARHMEKVRGRPAKTFKRTSPIPSRKPPAAKPTSWTDTRINTEAEMNGTVTSEAAAEALKKGMCVRHPDRKSVVSKSGRPLGLCGTCDGREQPGMEVIG